MQCYPWKNSSLWEYAHFLTLRGANLTLEGLNELDNGLRKLFLDHVDWHWQTTRIECQDMINEIFGTEEYKVKRPQQGGNQQYRSSAPSAPRGQGFPSTRGCGGGRGHSSCRYRGGVLVAGVSVKTLLHLVSVITRAHVTTVRIASDHMSVMPAKIPHTCYLNAHNCTHPKLLWHQQPSNEVAELATTVPFCTFP